MSPLEASWFAQDWAREARLDDQVREGREPPGAWARAGGG